MICREMFCYVLYMCVADVYVVLTERKLTSYVYAVGKQPSANLWCKMVEHGTASCEMWDGGRYAFCYLCVLFYVQTFLFSKCF